MPANVSTIGNILLLDQTDRLIRNTLQTDVAAWEQIPVKNRNWVGSSATVRLRAGRNNSVKSMTGTQTPVAGNQSFLVLTITSKKVIGTMQITHQMMQAAEKDGAVAQEPMDELTNLIADVKRKLCFFAFLGGGGLDAVGLGSDSDACPIGLTWERKNAGLTFGYTGRFDDIVAAVGGVNKARFVRMDTYAQVGVDTVITALSKETLTLAAVIDTSDVLVNVPICIFLTGVGSQFGVDKFVSGDNSAGNPCVFEAGAGDSIVEVGAFKGDPTGFLSNLCQVFHFGNDRSSTTIAKLKKIRSNFAVCGGTNNPAGDTLTIMDGAKLLARMQDISSEQPDEIWTTYTTYLAAVQALIGIGGSNLRVEASDTSKVGDPIAKMSAKARRGTYNGLPVMCSDQAIPRTMLFMRYDGWERSFLGNTGKEGQWLTVTGAGGDPLMKIPGSTDYEAARLIYTEQTCINPIQQGLLTAIANPVG